MANAAAGDIPSPGAWTVIYAAVAVTRSLPWMAAWSCVPLTTVVARSLPFQRITEPAVKFAPLTVRVKLEAPAVVVEGLREVIEGTTEVVPSPPPPHAAIAREQDRKMRTARPRGLVGPSETGTPGPYVSEPS